MNNKAMNWAIAVSVFIGVLGLLLTIVLLMSNSAETAASDEDGVVAEETVDEEVVAEKPEGSTETEKDDSNMSDDSEISAENANANGDAEEHTYKTEAVPPGKTEPIPRDDETADDDTYLNMFPGVELTEDMRKALIACDNGESNHAPNFYLIDYSMPENQLEEELLMSQYGDQEYVVSGSQHEINPDFRTANASEIVDKILADEGVDTYEMRYFEAMVMSGTGYNRYSIKVNNKCYTIYEQYHESCGGYDPYDTEAYCK